MQQGNSSTKLRMTSGQDTKWGPDVDVEHDAADEDDAADDAQLQPDLLQLDRHRPDGLNQVFYLWTSLVRRWLDEWERVTVRESGREG